ncbi:transposase [Streptomyces sp. HK10]|uniref:transposase n=1 Tax=Streptomyces sp. HK10 TaxID=3373255 RepID=UPI0037497D9C
MSNTLMMAVESARRAGGGRPPVVMYARVSTEDQRRGFGIAHTLKKMERYLARKDCAPVGVFRDEGYSGSLDRTQRPVLKRLMELARRGELPGVAVCVWEERAIGRRDGAFWPWVWEMVSVELGRAFSEEGVTRLNAALARTARRRFKRSGVHPLSKRLYYWQCGKHYTGVNRTDRVDLAYRCSGKVEKHAGAGRCSCPQVDAASIERLVRSEVCTLLGDPDRLQSMSEDWVNMAADSRVDYAAGIEDLERKIDAQNKAIAAVMAAAAKQAALSGQGPADAIAGAIAPLNEELAQVTKLKSEAEAWAEDAKQAQARAHDLRGLAKVARTRLADMQPAQQAEVLDLLDVRVTITGEVKHKTRKDDRLARWFRSRGRKVPFLTDEGWERVEPLFTVPRAGRPSASPRRHLEAMLHKVRESVPWPELPDSYDSPGSVATSAARWPASGLWDEIMERLADLPGSDLPENGIALPPLQVEGRIDPRLLIYTQPTPGSDRP